MIDPFETEDWQFKVIDPREIILGDVSDHPHLSQIGVEYGLPLGSSNNLLGTGLEAVESGEPPVGHDAYTASLPPVEISDVSEDTGYFIDPTLLQ